MGRGLSAMQNSILEALEQKKGMASTKALKTAIGHVSDQSFYRSLNSLQRRNLINWYKEHGGPHSQGGLVCLKRVNVLLVDVDSVIPNLALMKLSAFHKAQGDNVDLSRGTKVPSKIEYDLVYVSCIFKENARKTRRLAKRFPNAKVHLGGSGVDLKGTLPDEIEHLMPDYELYPECDASYGYTMRGCIRNCEFCIVPKKDGKAHLVSDIYEFWDRRHKKIVLLDDNILALPDHFKKIAGQIIKEGLRVDFQSGLDVRLLDDENAALLKAMHVSEPTFAWDDIKSEAAVLRGIEILRIAGINRAIWYVLVGFNTQFSEDLYRVNRLRELGQRVYVMPYNSDELFEKDGRYRHLRNWANARMYFASCTFDEYVRSKENGGQKQMAAARRERKKREKQLHPILQGAGIKSRSEHSDL
jgi:hypothetical protein